jgi:hypothetical protein
MRTLVSAVAAGVGGFVGAIIGAYAGWSPLVVGVIAASVAFVAVMFSRRIPVLF